MFVGNFVQPRASELSGGLKWGALFVVPILSIVSGIYTIWGGDMADRVCRILS